MREQTQISLSRELQIIYVDAPSSRSQDGEHNSALLKCGLDVVTSFQRVQYGKRAKNSLMVRKPNKPYLSHVTKANIKSDVVLMIDTLDWGR